MKMNQGPPQTPTQGKWGPNGWAPGHTTRGRRGQPADSAAEAQRPVCRRVAIATAGPASARGPPSLPAGARPAPRRQRPLTRARGRAGFRLARTLRPGGSRARNSAPGETFRPAGQPQGGGRGPLGDKVRRPARSPSPRSWAVKEGDPRVRSGASPRAAPPRDGPENPVSGTEKQTRFTGN